MCRTRSTAQNVDLPSGRLEGATNELSLRTLGRLSTAGGFREPHHQAGERPADPLQRHRHTPNSGAENLRTGNKSDLLYRIGVAIIPQPNTNAIAIADEFYKRLEQVKKEVPPDVTVEVGYDFTRFVRRSVAEVEETLVIAFGLVALIIFLFLRDWRSTIIPVIAIPVSIISGFFIMYVAGFSINVLTLVAIVLAIGLVCDDAIVVLENIYTKIEEGMTPLEAALKGSREIYFAVISTTVALAAVFLPIIFLSGLTGRLFREFGITLAGCVLVSAFVALTLSPMMCRFLLKTHGDKPNFFYRSTEPFFRMITARLPRRARAIPAAAAGWRFRSCCSTRGLIAWLVTRIPQRARTARGSREHPHQHHRAGGVQLRVHRELDGQDRRCYVEENVPEAFRSFSIIGGGGGRIGGERRHPEHLSESPGRAHPHARREIAEQLTREMQDFTGVRAIATQPPTIGDRRAGQPLAYVLQAPNLEALVKVLPEFLAEASKSPVLRQVDADLKVNRPEGDHFHRPQEGRRARHLGGGNRPHAGVRLLRAGASATSSRMENSTRSSPRCSARTATIPAI